MKVLLSIKPDFAKEILLGNKHYEYRKRIFRKDVDTVVMYVTKPVGLIVGEFRIKRIVEGTPAGIWSQTGHDAGIDKTAFDAYFKDYTKAYAIEIFEVMEYHTAINPYKVWTHFVAPQSFRYCL